MDTRLRTSFVPKKTLVARSDVSGRRGALNPAISIGMIIFFLTLAVSAGVFLYKVLLQKQVDKEQTDLIAAKDALVDEKWTADLKKLDNRLKTSRTLLDEHTVVSPIFDLISRTTLKTVRFTSLDLAVGANHTASVKMKGEAGSYTSVALLSDSFGVEKAWLSPLFSDVTLGTDKKNVTFSFAGSVDPSLVLYKTSFTGTGN
ncbi:hypothetical protein D4R99_05370 [bacterium]|nr:MAG: hypothetical protein D4R99_05370 [bacterium]